MKWIFAALLFIAIAAVPLVAGEFYINLATQILIAAIFALSLNLLVGYGGLTSLGHAAFLGFAAYACAYFSTRMGLGAAAAIPLAIVATTIMAGFFGLIALRATGLGFLMITLALSQVLWGLAYRWVGVTNGDNGMSGIIRPAPFGLSLASAGAYYWFTLIVASLAFAMMAVFVSSAATHVGAWAQCVADPMDHLCVCGLLGRRRGHPLHLLSLLHSPNDALDQRLGGSPAQRNRGRRGHALGTDRRRGADRAFEKLRLRLCRALEHAARLHLPAHRAGHPGRHRAGPAPPVPPHPRRREMNAPVPALEVIALQKYFGGLPATQDVSMTVMPGERRLIIGPNGAGKTTLFNQITGDFLPTSGAIKLFGRDITRLSLHERAHLGISRTYQIITLFGKNTLEHNITLALLGLHKSRWDAFRPLSHYESLRVEARTMLDRVGLGALADRRVSEIAYGEKRRVEIAMALAQKPRLLLLDEPLAGLSSEERASIKTFIAAIPRETTLVMIEHDMDTALELAETVTLLNFGKIIVDGPRDEVINDQRTRMVYLGE
jgi:branched-chain amino acid transport system ATP-binding protein